MQRAGWFLAGAASVAVFFLLFGGRREPEGHAVHEGHEGEGAAEHAGHEGEGSAEHAGHEGEGSAVKVSPDAQALLGLRVSTVEEAAATDRIAVVGEIAQDPERVEHVVSPRQGTVTSLNAALGAEVKKGERLAVIAPKGEAGGLDIGSPLGGIVLAQHVREGDPVDIVTSLYTVADLSRLAANFNVYEKDIGRVRKGQRLIVRSVAYPDTAFEGTVTFVSPRVEEKTHTIRIRATVENPGYRLKLGMFVSGEIICEEAGTSLLVPRSAVYSLDGKKSVFVRTSEDGFEARAVTVAGEGDTTVSVTSGVKKGDVVASGNAFLLKSELLKAKMGDGCAE